jgi:hypothetical protein
MREKNKWFMAFTIAIFFLGVTVAFFGKQIERIGHEKLDSLRHFCSVGG